MDFEFNPGWERQVGHMAFEAVRGRLQPALDAVLTEYGGRPIDEIKPVLAKAWVENTPGGSITDPDLTAYATEISCGRRIVLAEGEPIIS